MRGLDLHGHLSGPVLGTGSDVSGHDEEEGPAVMTRTSCDAPHNLPRPEHWSDRAACRGGDPTPFFPSGRDGVPAVLEAESAKKICGLCPVRRECLTHALTYREDHGVWGGLDERERAELLRQARLAAERQRRQQAKERTDAAAV